MKKEVDVSKMITIKKDAPSARGVRGRFVSGGRLVSLSLLASASILIASCASEPTNADSGSAPTPVVFSNVSQCTQPATMIPNQPSAAGQFANWASACATKAQDSGLRAQSAVNALQNAAKLYFAAGEYNLAAENGAASERLLDSLPSTNPRANSDNRFRFDSAFVSIAPTLALGLSEGNSNRVCGTKTACLVEGLEALESVESSTVRRTLNDPTRYYQGAAANLQTMNARANAILAQTSADGNVDKSLSILKSIISVVPAPGNEGLSAQATATLLDIAESSSDRAMTETGEVSSAIRYLTEAARVAPAGDSRRRMNHKLGGAYEARADGLLGNDDSGDNAAGLTSYCDGAKAYQLASEHSDKLISLEAMEGYAYGLSQIEQAGATNCNVTQTLAVDAFERSEQFRGDNNLPGHNKYLEAYGALLNRAERYAESAEAYQAADIATRGRTTTIDPTPGPDGKPKISFAGGDARANSLLVLAVTRSLSDNASDRAQAQGLFVDAQEADSTWPTSFLEHGKYLAKTGAMNDSNAKLGAAIRIANGNSEWSSQGAEAYFERSRNALSAENGASALSDAANAVLTNSSDPAYRRQACLAALYAEKGTDSSARVGSYCPSANTASAESLLSTEDLLLNAFRKHRDAQLVLGSASLRRKVQAFDTAADAYRQLGARADKTDAATWALPSGSYTFGDVALIGAWATDACGSLAGASPIPTPPNANTIINLFDVYGLQLCDVQ